MHAACVAMDSDNGGVQEAAQAAAPARAFVATTVVPVVLAADSHVPADGAHVVEHVSVGHGHVAGSNWADDDDTVSQSFCNDPASTPNRPPFAPSAADQAFSARREARQSTFRLSPSRGRPSSPASSSALAAASPFLARRVGSRAAAQTRFEDASPALLRVRRRIQESAMAEAPAVARAPKTDDEDVNFAVLSLLQGSLRDGHNFTPEEARAYA